MKKTIFSGFYGMGNYGDDLFGLVSVIMGRKYWGIGDYSLLGTAISSVDGQLSALVKRVGVGSYSRQNAFGRLLRLGYGLASSVIADRLVFSGGSLFGSETSGVRDLMLRVSRRRDIALGAIGVSVGPFASMQQERKVVSDLSAFDFISTRDRASFDLVDSYKLSGKLVDARDLVGLMPPAEKLVKSSGPSLLVYAPCNIVGKSILSEKINDICVNGIIKLSKLMPIRVAVISLNINNDLGDQNLVKLATEKFSLYFPATSYEYNQLKLEGTWSLFANSNFVLSTRMHGAISAFINEVPFALVEYHKKCKDFLDDIGQTSDSRLVLEGDCPCFTSSDVADIILRGMTMEISKELKVSDFTSKSKLNFTLAPWCLASS